MAIDLRQAWRTRPGQSMRAVVLAVLFVLAAGCATAPDAPSAAPEPVSGFQPGSYAKELVEPDAGHMRLVWTFAPDGRFAEVPFVLDGQRADLPPVRGRWSVVGDTLTIATDWPPDWGTSKHRWRLDGDRLWTVFVASDVPEDADWFSEWDTQPWVPVS